MSSEDASSGSADPTASNAPALLYHAAPLHYIPSILSDGALYPKGVLAERGISPRPTAVRRDRALGLARYVHLALQWNTPLLIDKGRKGFVHSVLVFDGDLVLKLPGVVLLPQNTKAWRSKAAYEPVTDPFEWEVLFRQSADGKRRGLEVLVPYGLSLDLLREIVVFRPDHGRLIERCAEAAESLLPSVTLGDESLLASDPAREAVLSGYFESCIAERRPLAPPDLPFD